MSIDTLNLPVLDGLDQPLTTEEFEAPREYPVVKSLSPSEKFAKDAITRCFAWLGESVNNPTYHESSAYLIPLGWLEAHAGELEKDLASRHAYVTHELEWADREHIASARDMFTMHDIAYAGIQEIIERAHYSRIDTPLEQVNRSAVAAIGATLVRMNYLSGILNEGQAASFAHMYRQNVDAHIRSAARLEQEISSLPDAEFTELPLYTEPEAQVA